MPFDLISQQEKKNRIINVNKESNSYFSCCRY